MSIRSLLIPKDVDAADTSATGVKLTYTTPTTGQKKYAKVLAASWRTNAGTAPVMQLQRVTAGALTIVLGVTDASGHFNVSPLTQIALAPGDTIRWNCTTLGAGSNGDGHLSIEELG